MPQQVKKWIRKLHCKLVGSKNTTEKNLKHDRLKERCIEDQKTSAFRQYIHFQRLQERRMAFQKDQLEKDFKALRNSYIAGIITNEKFVRTR